MKKDGFISTSLIYTFFILFLLLMVFLLNSYSSTRYLIEQYKNDIKEEFFEKEFADINVIVRIYNSESGRYVTTDTAPSSCSNFKSNLSYCNHGSIIKCIDNEIVVSAGRKDICYAFYGGV